MVKASREFQVFAKPVGAFCNLGCSYCYYLRKEHVHPKGKTFCMPDALLEKYIVQHIDASPGPVITFSWHGGEPTLVGLDYFRRIVALQRKHQPPGCRIVNGIQTNGTLLDADWCRFLAEEGFAVGLSLDGPRELHDQYRVTRGGEPTHQEAMRGYELLRQHHVYCDILCVVHAQNVLRPRDVYRFFKDIGAQYLGFLPLVEPHRDTLLGVSDRSVPGAAFGDFLIAIFDEWLGADIGRIKVQIFEEAAGTVLGLEHRLCIFQRTCGGVPVIEHNGDFFSCDHFVDREHRLGNIQDTPLVSLIESPKQQAFGRLKKDALPRYCRTCEVVAMCNGGCPKDRILQAPDGEAGLNYLCAGYKRFFNHCRPFVEQIAALQQSQAFEVPTSSSFSTRDKARLKIGRNDPCPCGSGRKYKKCCMGR